MTLPNSVWRFSLSLIISTVLFLALAACGADTGYLASADAHGWHATAHLVNIEAGPNGLQVEVMVRGPLTVYSPQCDRPLRAWLVDASGITANRSAVDPHPSDSCTQPYEQVAAGKTATYDTYIPLPLPHGTYTVHSLLDTGSTGSTENLPTLKVTLP